MNAKKIAAVLEAAAKLATLARDAADATDAWADACEAVEASARDALEALEIMATTQRNATQSRRAVQEEIAEGIVDAAEEAATAVAEWSAALAEARRLCPSGEE